MGIAEECGIKDFVEKEVEFDIKSETTKEELYQRYVEFCKKEERFLAEKTVFFKVFYRLCGHRVRSIRRREGKDGRRVRKIQGIRLKGE